MTDDKLIIESLRNWSQALLWISVALPVLGALAAGARYYVERSEKQISSRLTEGQIQSAKVKATDALREVGVLKMKSAPRSISTNQREKLIAELKAFNGQPIAFSCKMMDGESCNFAMQLIEIFREAGYQVPDLAKTSLNELPDYIVVTYFGNSEPSTLKDIVATLNSNEVSTKHEKIIESTLGVHYENILHIVVGTKRPQT